MWYFLLILLLLYLSFNLLLVIKSADVIDMLADVGEKELGFTANRFIYFIAFLFTGVFIFKGDIKSILFGDAFKNVTRETALKCVKESDKFKSNK